MMTGRMACVSAHRSGSTSDMVVVNGSALTHQCVAVCQVEC